MANSKKQTPLNYNFRQLTNSEPTSEGLSFSDYFDDSIPYEVKPVPSLVPIEEQDWPIQTKDLFKGLFEDVPTSQLKIAPLLKETDYVEYKKIQYGWDDSGVSIFLLYHPEGESQSKDYHANRIFYVASVFGIYQTIGFISNWIELANNLNKESFADGVETHSDLEMAVQEFSPEFPGHDILQGRLFEIQDSEYKYIMGFWEPPNVIKSFRKFIFQYLKELKIDPQKILWTHSNGVEVLSFEKMFDVKRKEKVRSKEQLELLKQIHLNAILKKKVLQLPPHPFTLLADKLGVTVTQLLQLAGSSLDEIISQPKEKTTEQILESVERGDGFWLDPKGVFHNVDEELGANGHLSWAKRFFKKIMSYDEVMELGYIWIGVMEDTNSINFMYHITPSPTQMYLLKKTAADENLGLYDINKKEHINTKNFQQETNIFLLKEVEGAYDFNGREFSWRNSEAKGIFTIFNNSFWCAQLGKPENIEYECSNKQIEKELNSKNIYKTKVGDVNYITTHNSMFDFIKSAMKAINFDSNLDADDYHGVIASRVFKMNDGKVVVGFWQPMDVVRKYWKLIEKILQDVFNIYVDQAKYTFDDYYQPEEEYNYSDIVGTTGSRKIDPKELELMKIQHLNPEAKKVLLHKYPLNYLQDLADKMHIPLAKLRTMLGSIDEVEYIQSPSKPKKKYWYDDKEGISVILIFDDFSVWTKYNVRNNTTKFFSDNLLLANNLNLKFGNIATRTHDSLKYKISDIMHSDHYKERHSEKISGRIFDTPDGIFVAFWQNFKKVKPGWSKIENIIESVGYNPENCRYAFGANGWDLYSYGQAKLGMGIAVTSEEQLTLLKLIHLNSQAKKAILQIPPNRFQRLADSLKITVVQLRHMLGGMDEEMKK